MIGDWTLRLAACGLFGKAESPLSFARTTAGWLLDTATLNVTKLESFKGQKPYDVHGKGKTTRLKFLKTDPLPVVSVRINGSDEITFFIDTGASEVALDTEFTKELGLPQFGEV
jgi:Aspartyl protease